MHWFQVSIGHGVLTYLSTILSLIFSIPFSFQDIILVCWNVSLQVLIMKCLHKDQQKEYYLENEGEIENYVRQYCRL